MVTASKSPFYSNSTLPILCSKKCTLPHENYFLIFLLKNICHICNFFGHQGPLNALWWKVIPENINLGKIGNIWTLHHRNWYKIISSYYTEIQLISYSGGSWRKVFKCLNFIWHTWYLKKSCSMDACGPEFFGCYGNQNYFFEHL